MARRKRVTRPESEFRRKIRESNNPLVKEADVQVRAIHRLDTWKRLAYSGLAVGTLLVGYGLSGGLGQVAVVTGVALLVISAPCAALLAVGTSRARKNVMAILDVIEAQGRAAGDR